MSPSRRQLLRDRKKFAALARVMTELHHVFGPGKPRPKPRKERR